jgi:hypothetical protein
MRGSPGARLVAEKRHNDDEAAAEEKLSGGCTQARREEKSGAGGVGCSGGWRLPFIGLRKHRGKAAACDNGQLNGLQAIHGQGGV